MYIIIIKESALLTCQTGRYLLILGTLGWSLWVLFLVCVCVCVCVGGGCMRGCVRARAIVCEVHCA